MRKAGFCCPECGAILLVCSLANPPAFMKAPSDGELLAKRVDEISWDKRIGARIVTVFRNNEIVTVADLIKHTESELLRSPNFGKHSLALVKQWLTTRGLHLGMGE